VPTTHQQHQCHELRAAAGDFGDAKVIKKFGDVPDELSAL
jgi:hypothetical protein